METCFAHTRSMMGFARQSVAYNHQSPFAGLPDDLPTGTKVRFDANGFVIGHLNGSDLTRSAARNFISSEPLRAMAASSAQASYASFALASPSDQVAGGPTPPPAFQHSGLLAGALGDWHNLAGNTAGTASADGFLLVSACASLGGDRGWANVRVGGKIRGSCAIQGDCAQQTFWVPLTRGEQWRLASAATAGSPAFTAHWIALRSLTMTPLRQLHPNMVYRAHTDGFLITVLEAGDGGRAIGSLQSGATRALLDVNPVHGAASVHLDTRSGIILPSSTATAAVQRGQFYRAALRISGNPVAFSMYWVGLTA